jgi:hypothetical protein
LGAPQHRAPQKTRTKPGQNPDTFSIVIFLSDTGQKADQNQNRTKPNETERNRTKCEGPLMRGSAEMKKNENK